VRFAKVCIGYFPNQIYNLLLQETLVYDIPHAPTKAKSFAKVCAQPPTENSD
jgi:hypothetical protein